MLGLRVDGHEQDVVALGDVVDHAIATAGATLSVSISNTYLVNRVTDTLDLIARRLADLQLVDERLEISTDAPVLARKSFELALEGFGVTNTTRSVRVDAFP